MLEILMVVVQLCGLAFVITQTLKSDRLGQYLLAFAPLTLLLFVNLAFNGWADMSSLERTASVLVLAWSSLVSIRWLKECRRGAEQGEQSAEVSVLAIRKRPPRRPRSIDATDAGVGPSNNIVDMRSYRVIGRGKPILSEQQLREILRNSRIRRAPDYLGWLGHALGAAIVALLMISVFR
ncbi:MAG: hypothetical protein NT159_07410 [Proteobacteria bacterium]|nr:hypothetical protein [Pseudomonadota bacterium]